MVNLAGRTVGPVWDSAEAPMNDAFQAPPQCTARDPVGWAALVSLALLVGVLGGLGAAVLGAAPAAAHASLQSTDPEADQLLDVAPDVIRLVFDEPVEVALGGVDVIDPEGGRLGGSAELADDGLAVVVPFDESGQGTYTVAWRVVSEDGHPISGSFVFHLGERTGSVAAETGTATSTRLIGAAGRWLALAGVLVSVGGLIFAVAVAGGDGTDPSVRRLRPLVAAAALLDRGRGGAGDLGAGRPGDRAGPRRQPRAGGRRGGRHRASGASPSGGRRPRSAWRSPRRACRSGVATRRRRARPARWSADSPLPPPPPWRPP